MTQKGRQIKTLPTLLWIGDAVAHTGFAHVTHSVLDQLMQKYTVYVLGVNYFGDPHTYKYPIFPAPTGGDVFGIKRIPTLLQKIKPHITCILNDPWLVKDYIKPLRTPVGQMNGQNAFTNIVAYMPIYGKNIQNEFVEPLNDIGHSIFYTDFALQEARKGGLTTQNVSVIPHGVDAKDFPRMSTHAARAKLPAVKQDWFVVGCINRNQPRKRLDLALQYFAEFAKNKPDTVKFYYHGALQDVGWNILQLADYYGIQDRLIITDPSMTTAFGVPKETLKFIYNSFDVQITTTLGEGWGLTQMEGMSCGVPQIAPDWSALGEWAKEGAALIPCTGTQANPGGLNTIGGVIDKTACIKTLNEMYHNAEYRKMIGQRGYDLVHQEKFTWKVIANQFDTVFKKVMLHHDSA